MVERFTRTPRQQVRDVFVLLLLLVVGASSGGKTSDSELGTDNADWAGCGSVSAGVEEYRHLVSNHPWSGRAWQV